MSKKSGLNLLYLVGMIAVVVGSFLPIFVLDWGVYGKTTFSLITAIKSLSFANSWYTLIMVGAAVTGIAVEFAGAKKAKLIEIIALVVSIVCVILLLVDEGFFEYMSFSILGAGLYVIVAGWIIALVGALIKK